MLGAGKNGEFGFGVIVADFSYERRNISSGAHSCPLLDKEKRKIGVGEATNRLFLYLLVHRLR